MLNLGKVGVGLASKAGNILKKSGRYLPKIGSKAKVLGGGAKSLGGGAKRVGQALKTQVSHVGQAALQASRQTFRQAAHNFAQAPRQMASCARRSASVAAHTVAHPFQASRALVDAGRVSVSRALNRVSEVRQNVASLRFAPQAARVIRAEEHSAQCLIRDSRPVMRPVESGLRRVGGAGGGANREIAAVRHIERTRREEARITPIFGGKGGHDVPVEPKRSVRGASSVQVRKSTVGPTPRPEGIDLRRRIRKNAVPHHKVVYRAYTGHDPKWHVHHGLPRELKPWFEENGINIDSGEYYFDLPPELHNKIPGVHTNSSALGKNWNKIWMDFKNEHEHDATKELITEQLNKMAHECGIEQYRAVKKGSK